jgi:hypothetical protein
MARDSSYNAHPTPSMMFPQAQRDTSPNFDKSAILLQKVISRDPEVASSMRSRLMNSSLTVYKKGQRSLLAAAQRGNSKMQQLNGEMFSTGPAQTQTHHFSQASTFKRR